MSADASFPVAPKWIRMNFPCPMADFKTPWLFYLHGTVGGLCQVLPQIGGKYRVREEVMLETWGLPSSLFAWHLESPGWVSQDSGSSTQSAWPYSSGEACMLPLQLSASDHLIPESLLGFYFALMCLYSQTLHNILDSLVGPSVWLFFLNLWVLFLRFLASVSFTAYYRQT